MKFKLTSLEKKWVLYDVGNSAFTMMVSTIFPIYFNFLAGNAGISDVDYLAYWGYATSICTLLVAILGPTLGAVADTKNFKKTIFCIAMGVGVFGCILLGFLSSWIWFLGVFVLAKTGYSASLVFYDAMLTDVTEPERMDTVSSHGYAWGYIGSCIPFVACLGIVLGGGSLGMDMQTSMILAFLITALWWLFSSVPLLRSYRQRYFAEAGEHVVRNSFQRLGRTFAELVKQKQIFVFLLAFFFYIDGVYTVIDMATAYGQALGLDSTGLLLALLVTQIVAFPSVLIFSRIIKMSARRRSLQFVSQRIFVSRSMRTGWIHSLTSGSLPYWSVCSRGRSRRSQDLISQRSSLRRNQGNISESMISAERELLCSALPLYHF